MDHGPAVVRTQPWKLLWALLKRLASVILAGTALGCAATPNITLPASNQSVEPHEDMATLVVIQPGTRYGYVNLLDRQGKPVGQIHDRSYTVLRIPPGPFRLYLMPEAQAKWGDRIEGDVLANKVYFATVSLRWGGAKINALNPRSPDQRWLHREEWLKERPRVQMDPAQVNTLIQAIGDPKPLMETINGFAEGLDKAHREVRTVRAADGL